MAEQHLDDAHVGPVLQEMGRECVPQGMHCHRLAQAGRSILLNGRRRAARSGRADAHRRGMESAIIWPSEPPIRPQNPQKLRSEHNVTVLALLAVLDPDQH